MPTGDRETRIRRLEQIAEELSSLLSIGTRRLVAAEQDAYDLWAAGLPYTQVSNANCTFSGQAAACAGLGLPNAVLTATLSGVLVWSGTADASGNYSGSLTLPGGVSHSVVINCAPSPSDPFAARFSAANTTVTLSPGANSLGRSIGLNLASGYACSQYAYYPLKTTLFLTDSFYGAATLTYTSGSPSSWRGTHNISFPGCAATFCPTAATSAIRYDLFQLTTNMQMGFNTTGFCPNSTTGGFQNDSTVSLAVTNPSPITMGVTVTLSSTLYCGRVVSFTCTE